MRISEIPLGCGTLDELGIWGFNPVQCLLGLLDNSIEEIEGGIVSPERVRHVAGTLLNIKGILENYLKDIQEFTLRYESDYVKPMVDRLKELERKNKEVVES